MLFVCTGNLCRSPTARGLATLYARELALELTFDAAGIAAEVGMPPAPLAVQVALEYGVDISGFRSRPVEPADFERHARIVAMDLIHLDFLRAIAPRGSRAAIELLLDPEPTFASPEVPDPYGRKLKFYRQSAAIIAGGLQALLAGPA